MTWAAQLAERTFASVDDNGDGMISAQDFGAVAEPMREIRILRAAPVCE